MKKLIYGTDTGSVEDYDQCIVLAVPEDADYDGLLEGADPYDLPGVVVQTVVTWEDVADALDLALQAHAIYAADRESIISAVARESIIATVRDAVDNND